MSYDLRSISYLAELIHPPVQHDVAQLQQLYRGFSEPRTAAPYLNFNVVPGGAQLGNAVAKGASSTATFLPDRVQVFEQHTAVAPEDFVQRTMAVAQAALASLSLQVFLTSQFVVRALINPVHIHDTRELIGARMCNFADGGMSGFERKPNVFGVRLAFPQDPSSVQTSLFNVRIESFNADVRSLFIENSGVFPVPMVAQQLDRIGDDFRTTYDFIQSDVARLVAHFDRPAL